MNNGINGSASCQSVRQAVKFESTTSLEYRANPDAVDDVTSYTCMATVTNVVEEQIIGGVSQ